MSQRIKKMHLKKAKNGVLYGNYIYEATINDWYYGEIGTLDFTFFIASKLL